MVFLLDDEQKKISEMFGDDDSDDDSDTGVRTSSATAPTADASGCVTRAVSPFDTNGPFYIDSLWLFPP
jgi:hypothetical protein